MPTVHLLYPTSMPPYLPNASCLAPPCGSACLCFVSHLSFSWVVPFPHCPPRILFSVLGCMPSGKLGVYAIRIAWGVCHPESSGCKAVPFFYPEHEAVNSARKNEVLLIYEIYRFALNRSFSMKSNVVSFPSVTPYSRSVL